MGVEAVMAIVGAVIAAAAAATQIGMQEKARSDVAARQEQQLKKAKAREAEGMSAHEKELMRRATIDPALQAGKESRRRSEALQAGLGDRSASALARLREAAEQQQMKAAQQGFLDIALANQQARQQAAQEVAAIEAAQGGLAMDTARNVSTAIGQLGATTGQLAGEMSLGGSELDWSQTGLTQDEIDAIRTMPMKFQKQIHSQYT